MTDWKLVPLGDEKDTKRKSKTSSSGLGGFLKPSSKDTPRRAEG